MAEPRPAPGTQTRSRADWLTDKAAAVAIAVGGVLPLGAQARLAQVTARTALSRQTRQAATNLAAIWPDLPETKRQEIAQASVANMARGMIEIADSKRLLARAQDWAPTGGGWDALQAAHKAGRPVILVTGHFGNWEAARAALTCRGLRIGGLYRPLNNGYLDDRWTRILAGLSGPVYPRGREGLRGLLRHIKSGGITVILHDQFVADGALLDFLGKPAPTALSPAELALRHDAALIPFYGVRQAGGRDFDVVIEAPIPPASPEAMMQAATDSLARQVTARPEQWLWPHRRWKPERIRHRLESEATNATASS